METSVPVMLGASIQAAGLASRDVSGRVELWAGLRLESQTL